MGTTESVLSNPVEEVATAMTGAPDQHDRPPSHHARGPHRRRPRPAQSGSSRSLQSAPTPVCNLKGVVLGLPKSGKRTLLDRLQGKDPFAVDDDVTANHSALPQARPAPVSNIINAPYQATAKTWDKISLEVSCLEALPETVGSVDFAVLLVHPEHKRKRSQKHLRQSLRNLLQQLGYGRSHEEHDDANEAHDGDASDANGQSSTAANVVHRPLCLCVLINFRDLLGDKADEDFLVEIVNDITSTTMEVLQDYPTLEPDRLVLACGHVSLFNCYNLQLLHSFIYQAYLQRKRYDLEVVLEEIHAAKRKIPSVATMKYEEYLNKLLPTNQQLSRRTNSSESQLAQKDAAKARGSEEEADKPRQEAALQPVARRKIIPDQVLPTPQDRPKQLPPTSSAYRLSGSKAALEAFLADSDSEQEEQWPGRSRQKEDTSDGNDGDDGFVVSVSSDLEPPPQETSQREIKKSDSTAIKTFGSHVDDEETASLSHGEVVKEVSPSSSAETLSNTLSESMNTADQTADTSASVGMPVETDSKDFDEHTDAMNDSHNEIQIGMGSKITASNIAETNSAAAGSAKDTPDHLQRIGDDDSSGGEISMGESLSKQGNGDNYIVNDYDDDDDEAYVIQEAAGTLTTDANEVVSEMVEQNSSGMIEDDGNEEGSPSALSGRFSKEVMAALAAARLEAEEMLKPLDGGAKKKVKKDKKAKKKSRAQ